MNYFLNTPNLVKEINVSFLPAKLLGFSNLSYDNSKKEFITNRILYFYSWILFSITALLTAILIISFPIFKETAARSVKINSNAYYQDLVVQSLNFSQLWFGIFITYYNHTANQLEIQYILNGILKCNRDLIKITKTVAPPVKRYRQFSIIWVYTTILDILCTFIHPFEIFEWKPLVYANKVVVAAAFLQWHIIQTQLTVAYDNLNDFVKRKSGNLRAKDIRAISAICTQIHRIHSSCDRYFGQFAFVTYLSLVRTVTMSYECLGALLFTVIKRFGLHVFVHTLYFLAVSAVTPLVDALVLVVMAEYLPMRADRFYWRVLLSVGESKRELELRQNTPCCNKFYKCRYCHDENETHHFDRKTLTELICVECNTRQKVQEQCEKCGVRFGKYTCLICNLFDDEDKDQYHCDDCGICRIGGRDNFFHCEVCNMCLPIELKIEGHRCVENISRSNCPVCLGAIHTSRIPCHIPECGHLLHKMCFDQLLASGHYVCPTCQTSLLDMTKMWEYLDAQALLMAVPKKYENQRVYIFCNDCHETCKTKFHFVGLKCIHCGGYNTTQDVKRRMSWANGADSSTSA